MDHIQPISDALTVYGDGSVKRQVSYIACLDGVDHESVWLGCVSYIERHLFAAGYDNSQVYRLTDLIKTRARPGKTAVLDGVLKGSERLVALANTLIVEYLETDARAVAAYNAERGTGLVVVTAPTITVARVEPLLPASKSATLWPIRRRRYAGVGRCTETSFKTLDLIEPDHDDGPLQGDVTDGSSAHMPV